MLQTEEWDTESCSSHTIRVSRLTADKKPDRKKKTMSNSGWAENRGEAFLSVLQNPWHLIPGTQKIQYTKNLDVGFIKDNSKAEERERKEKWMEEFLSTSPNPVFRAEIGGRILYANRACDFLLQEWKLRPGDKLPPPIETVVRKVILRGAGEELEVRAGGRVFLFAFHPLPEEENVNICGFDITVQKQAEEELKKSEEKYRHVAEQTGQLILDYDIKSGHAGWAGAIEKLTGYPAEEFQGFGVDAFMELIHPEDREKVLEAHEKCMKSGEKYHEEYRLRRKDGSYFHVEGAGIYLKDGSGSTYRVLGAVKDITERKLSRQKLEKEEKKYRLVSEQTGMLVFDYDAKKDEIQWAGAIEKLTGYGFKELQGVSEKFWLEHIHPEDREKVRKTHEKCMKDECEFRMDYRFSRKDGTYFYVEDQGIYMKDEEGSSSRILGVMKDITERKLAEEELRKSEERYRLVAEQTGQIVYDYHLREDKADWAGPVGELTGYKVEDINKEGIDFWIEHVHPEDRERVWKIHEEFIESGGTYGGEYRFRKKDGSYLHIEDLGVALKDERGRIYRILGVMKNITERKLAEETIKKAEETRMKEIHHRIKNNLQVISSLLDLQADFFSEENVTEAFRESQNRVISMALIHEELYKSKSVESLDFTHYLRKLAKELLLSYEVGHSKINLHIDAENDVFMSMDTAIPLGMIVNELVSNSLKHAFTSRSEGEIRITLFGMENRAEENRNSEEKEERGEKEEKRNYTIRDLQNSPKNVTYCELVGCMLTVSDNGSGFPENINFEHPDTLGLQLVNTLVKQIEGKIELIKNGGTEFRIRFGKNGR